MEARMAGEFVGADVLKFVGWLMPAVIIFFVSRRIRTGRRRRLSGFVFYIGFSLMMLGIAIIDVMRWIGLGPASTAEITLVTHAILDAGVFVLYAFVLDMLVYLEDVGWEDCLLNDLPLFLLVSVLMASTYANLSPYPVLSVISFIDNISAFAVALTYAALGRILKDMGSRIWWIATVGGAIFCLSIAAATYPEVLLFSGRITFEEHDTYSWIREYILQIIAGLIALLPAVGIGLRSGGERIDEVAGTYGIAINEYLDRMSIFGPEVYDTFRSVLSEAGLRDGTLKVRESEWPALLERIILVFYMRFGRAAIDTARGVDGMKKAAEATEEFVSFGSDLRF
jgi:hypothetical protein